jgi:membrane-associated phospholipid phosphatase
MVKLVNRGDVVADWNATLLNAVRDWTTTSNDPVPNRIVNSRPAEVTKNLAMVHAAMFDAINAVEGKYRSYLADLPSDPLASPITALATAAHRVSIHLYPDANQVAVLDATLAASLASVPEGTAKQRGVLLGEAIARRMIEAREGDGSSAPSTYTPSGEIGRWGRTGPGFLPPELPMWGQVKPFVLEDVTGVRVAAPPALDSAEYAAAVDQVMRVGRVDSTARTIEQTEIANFWADGAGTATPPGHWNRIASDVLMSRSPELIDSARTMAMLNLALADAAIAAWDVKYLYDFWRPIGAINQAAADGNDATVQDASWTPLLRTPPHPTYVSGHSTFSAAAATVLTHLLGDNVSFTTTNDPKTGLTQTPIPVQSLVTRRFANFAEAAEEAGSSRVYGGIHFPFDNTAGQALGRSVGEAIVNSQL